MESETGNSIKFALLDWLPLWLTGAQSCRGFFRELYRVCLRLLQQRTVELRHLFIYLLPSSVGWGLLLEVLPSNFWTVFMCKLSGLLQCWWKPRVSTERHCGMWLCAWNCPPLLHQIRWLKWLAQGTTNIIFRRIVRFLSPSFISQDFTFMFPSLFCSGPHLWHFPQIYTLIC